MLKLRQDFKIIQMRQTGGPERVSDWSLVTQTTDDSAKFRIKV